MFPSTPLSRQPDRRLNQAHLPSSQGGFEESRARGDDGLASTPRRTGVGSSETSETMVSCLKAILRSDFLSPFTDKLGSSLKQINSKLQSMSNGHDVLQDEIKRVKHDMIGDSSRFSSSLSQLSQTLSDLHNVVLKRDDSNDTMMKNIKNNLSTLTVDMYEREKIREIEKKNDKKE